MHFLYPINLVLYHYLTLMYVIALCNIDGVNWSRRTKVLGSVGTSLVFSFFVIQSKLNSPKVDDSFIHITDTFSISIYELYSSSAKILALFFWQQTWFLILYPNRCVNIKHAPYFKWE